MVSSCETMLLPSPGRSCWPIARRLRCWQPEAGLELCAPVDFSLRYQGCQLASTNLKNRAAMAITVSNLPFVFEVFKLGIFQICTFGIMTQGPALICLWRFPPSASHSNWPPALVPQVVQIQLVNVYIAGSRWLWAGGLRVEFSDFPKAVGTNFHSGRKRIILPLARPSQLKSGSCAARYPAKHLQKIDCLTNLAPSIINPMTKM